MKSSEPEFITIGRILAPWGTQGKLKVEVATDFPERFDAPSQVYVKRQPVTIDSAEWHKGKVIVKLDVVNSIEDAEKQKGEVIEIHYSQLHRLPEGQYYHFQLIGLKVKTVEGELLGSITDILTASSNDNYVVSTAEGEILIPAVEGIVKSIDLNQGCLVIEPIEGLLTLNRKTGS